MDKGKRQKAKQCNGQRKSTKEHTIKWPKEDDKRTNNIMAKEKREKDKQYNGQRKTTKGQTI